MYSCSSLVSTVLVHYKKEGRNMLPWRNTRDPYKILVSEIMLQQTQVDRVIPKYKTFLTKFPTVEALAEAPLRDVLEAWQGLGYNRRGKYLQEAVRVVIEKYKGKFPKDPEQLEELPGVGPYTARAIAAFAFNRPSVFIETNIRTVFTHLCFPKKRKVTDRELLSLIRQSLLLTEKREISPREWYWALMDYGSYLKKSGVRINNKSVHYVRQSKFEGSSRQLRGAILRELLKTPSSIVSCTNSLQRPRDEVYTTFVQLKEEGLITCRGGIFSIAN